jgi:phenylacetate-CoA ligase
MELYWRLPIGLQELGLAMYAQRLDKLYYGEEFERWKTLVLQWLDRPWKDAQEWQLERAREIITIARDYVPYYRSALAEIDPASLRSIDDLRHLPVLTKQRIRAHEKDFIDERFDTRKAIIDRTSGSTGTALTVYWPPHALQRKWATNEVTVRFPVGVDRFTPRAMMGGRPIVRGSRSRPPFWRYNRRWGQLYLSSYHISSRNAPAYVEAIRRSGVVWLDGYGSAIGALAQDALNAGLTPLKLKSVVVSGDTLQPGMRRSIEEFFQCKCYNHYGQAEGLCWIMECSHGNLHPIPEFGIVEILRSDGSPTAPGEVGEIVATGLLGCPVTVPLWQIVSHRRSFGGACRRLSDHGRWAFCGKNVNGGETLADNPFDADRSDGTREGVPPGEVRHGIYKKRRRGRAE